MRTLYVFRSVVRGYAVLLVAFVEKGLGFGAASVGEENLLRRDCVSGVSGMESLCTLDQCHNDV